MIELHEVQTRSDPIRRYIAPASLPDALATLADLGSAARPVAGGTDLLLELSRGACPEVEVLVDLSVITGLDAIEESDGRVELGALVTHSAVVGHDRMPVVGLPLAQACFEVGGPPLRNRATVAGNIVTASPANDTISALYALDADVTIDSLRGERVVPVRDFFTGFRSTVLAPGELVTSISFDALDGHRRGVFVKLGLRRAQAISVVHAAAVASFEPDGTVEDLTVALGSVGPTVELVEAAPGLARGRCLDDVAAEVAEAAAASVEPIDDLRASAEYRTRAVSVMVQRTLRALAAGVEADTWTDSPRLAAGERPVRPSLRRDLTDEGIVTATVNGRRRRAPNAASATLLDWLRDELGLTGTKEGCAEGECGACTVHLDDRAVLACLVPAARADGTDIVTVEGLAEVGSAHRVQAAMNDCGGVQCGFCTPGFVMSAVKLVEEVPAPTRQQVEHGLAGNLCRCTGYYRIIQAVQNAGSQDPGSPKTGSQDHRAPIVGGAGS